MNNYYVYIYCDPREEASISLDALSLIYKPFYVGYGKGNRLFYHIKEVNYNTRVSHKKNRIKAILKSGATPLITKVHENISLVEARKLEKYYITVIGRRDLSTGPLCNLTSGGEGLNNPSQETRRKIGNRSYKTGKDNYFYGKNLWKEGVRVLTPDTRDKLRLTHLGKLGTKHTEEWKKNHSLRMSGEGNPNYNGQFGMLGKTHSKQTRKKQSDSAKKVSCVLEGVKYSSYKEAASVLNISYDAARYRSKREAQLNTQ